MAKQQHYLDYFADSWLDLILAGSTTNLNLVTEYFTMISIEFKHWLVSSLAACALTWQPALIRDKGREIDKQF